MFGGEKMRKIIALLAVAMFLGGASSIGIYNIHPSKEAKMIVEKESFGEFQTAEYENYETIVCKGANYLHKEGYPSLPYTTKTYYFPLGTKVKVECKPLNVKSIKLEKKILPASSPKPLGIDDKITEAAIYQKDEFYPSKWYDYTLGGGLHDGQRVTIVSVHFYPYQYNAVRNELKYAEDFDIEIKYEGSKTLASSGDYDLLIITPKEFEDALQPLVEHKESHGIRTLVMRVDDIYSSYSGRDGAEKVKYAIKDAIEEHGIKYVLLVGGKKSYLVGNWGYDGPTKVDDSLWWVPVRYVALNDMEEHGYLSDLYFADIYDAEGNFSTWDPNGNGIYGEWRMTGRDKGIDFYPDVYVGRLACRSVKEVQNVVSKIIEYENNAYGQQWFKRMLLIDTFNDGQQLCEGEISTLWFYEHHMQDLGFEKVSLFVSDGTLPLFGMDNEMAGRLAWINVIQNLNTGFGFVCMDGHGSPTAWATHFQGHASHNDPWVNGLMTYNMDLMHNKGMYPVVVIGGCHNSEFNISLLDFQKNEWTYQPTYE
ncbi:MAG: hypothetical protein FE036_03315 [Thermoplasmata archaeon]|nr:MAG: hypothetical protein FE036_03315 [Thermoplasmata archaeon]